jgi:ABC-type dipeptide/oligopeptide/nickel transport system permease component
MNVVPSLNWGRSVFVRALATAIAIVVIVFALTAGFGNPSLVPSVVFEGKIIDIILSYAPLTAELIVASFILASFVGFALTLSSARAFTAAVSGVVTGLLSIPVFVLAIVLQIVLGVHLGLPSGGACSIPCTLGDQLQHLIVPATTLGIYQVPALVAFFRRHRVAAGGSRATETSITGDLATLFAERLPDVLSAAIIVEAIYAWSGEGRLLFEMHIAYDADKGAYVAYLMLNALVLLLIRTLAELIRRRDPSGAEASE